MGTHWRGALSYLPSESGKTIDSGNCGQSCEWTE